MFKKIKAKAGQPLTYGWLWKSYLGEIIAVGVIYGGMYAYGYIAEKKANKAEAAAKENNEFEDED